MRENRKEIEARETKAHCFDCDGGRGKECINGTESNALSSLLFSAQWYNLEFPCGLLSVFPCGKGESTIQKLLIWPC